MGNCFISLSDLASICQMHPQTIQMHRANARLVKLLDGLPDPVRARPFLLWLKSDIESWLGAKSTLLATSDEPQDQEYQNVIDAADAAVLAPHRRKPGRPKKKLIEGFRL